jgi:molybdate transport system substrate-binding protein
VRRSLPVALTLSALALTACAGGGSVTDSAPSVSSTRIGGSDPAVGPLTVFAASSLKEVFTTLGAQFEALHPGAQITFSFGSSSTLATQIVQGAPADVFASASTTTMRTVVDAGVIPQPHSMATNTLEIATPVSPTVAVAGLADLAKPGVKVAVCQRDVPCGAATATLFAANQLTVTPVSQEVDVKSVLSKVVLGEVDAGVVYVTDVKAAKDTVVGVPIPPAQNVSTTYQIGSTTGQHSGVAGEFVDYVLSAEGQRVLATAGFSSP